MQIWAWHPGLDQISAKDDSIWHENFEQQPPSADSGAIIGPKKKKNKKKQKVTAALQLFRFVGVGDCLANVKVVVCRWPDSRLKWFSCSSRCIRTVSISWSSLILRFSRALCSLIFGYQWDLRRQLPVLAPDSWSGDSDQERAVLLRLRQNKFFSYWL